MDSHWSMAMPPVTVMTLVTVMTFVTLMLLVIAAQNPF
jgi:hypothetical protein